LGRLGRHSTCPESKKNDEKIKGQVGRSLNLPHHSGCNINANLVKIFDEEVTRVKWTKWMKWKGKPPLFGLADSKNMPSLLPCGFQWFS
jgi:hypothetical protein